MKSARNLSRSRSRSWHRKRSELHEHQSKESSKKPKRFSEKRKRASSPLSPSSSPSVSRTPKSGSKRHRNHSRSAGKRVKERQRHSSNKRQEDRRERSCALEVSKGTASSNGGVFCSGGRRSRQKHKHVRSPLDEKIIKAWELCGVNLSDRRTSRAFSLCFPLLELQNFFQRLFKKLWKNKKTQRQKPLGLRREKQKAEA